MLRQMMRKCPGPKGLLEVNMHQLTRWTKRDKLPGIHNQPQLNSEETHLSRWTINKNIINSVIKSLPPRKAQTQMTSWRSPNKHGENWALPPVIIKLFQNSEEGKIFMGSFSEASVTLTTKLVKDTYRRKCRLISLVNIDVKLLNINKPDSIAH